MLCVLYLKLCLSHVMYHAMYLVVLCRLHCMLCHAVLCVCQVIFCYACYQRSFIHYSILKIFDIMELMLCHIYMYVLLYYVKLYMIRYIIRYAIFMLCFAIMLSYKSL